MIPPSLRKAAVLISTLDERAAEAILNELSPEDAAKVRRAVVELEEIPTTEQQHVLAEFLSRQGAPALAASTDGGVELDIDLEAPSLAEPATEIVAEQPSESVSESLFAFLGNIDPSAIAAVLGREQTQTIAAIVSQLSPTQAAAVLENLPPKLATDALERMASLVELAPEIQHDLVQELRCRLAPQLHAAAAGPASLARLSSVLNAMGQNQRQRAVRQLSQQNAALARRAGLLPDDDQAEQFGERQVIAFRYRIEPKRLESKAKSAEPARSPASSASWLDFDDLAQLDDASLKAVFAACEPEVALIALTGAEPPLVNRIVRHLSPEQATVLRQRLDQPGPIRLREIEQARNELAAAAVQLARDGAIALPPRIRFAAAV